MLPWRVDKNHKHKLYYRLLSEFMLQQTQVKTVIPYLDQLSPEAEQTQSVNTIILSNDNLLGHNTDIAGFTRAIEGLNFDIQGKKIFILPAIGLIILIYGIII